MSSLRRWPWPFLLLIVGALLATAGVRFLTLPPGVFLAVFLPPLLFDAGFSMRLAAIRREAAAILLLGVLGAVVAALFTFGLLRVVGFPFEAALLLAALLAATDPISVFAVLRRLHAPERVRVVLEGESLANDAVAVVLFAVALSTVQHAGVEPVGLLTLFLRLTLGGLLAGLLLGAVVQLLLRRVAPALGAGLTLVAAVGGYLAAQALGLSGLLCVIVMALAAGNAAGAAHHLIHRFWRALGFAISSLVFLLVGLQMRVDTILAIGRWLALLFLVVLLARFVMVALLTQVVPHAWSWAWRAAVTWAGLRGALSLALAIAIPASVPARDDTLALTFGFVFVSLAVQGLTVGPVFRALGVAVSPIRPQTPD